MKGGWRQLNAVKKEKLHAKEVKMRKGLGIVAAAAIVLALAGAAYAGDGRYQVVCAGRVICFKIDTKTGDVWVLRGSKQRKVTDHKPSSPTAGPAKLTPCPEGKQGQIDIECWEKVFNEKLTKP